MIAAFVLLIVFGVVQLATVTFYQLAADGASFVGAHDTVAQAQTQGSTNLAMVGSNVARVFNQIAMPSLAAGWSGSAFETDVDQPVPGITIPIEGAPIAVRSREVEAAAGNPNPTPLPNCISSTLNVGSTVAAAVPPGSPQVKLLSGNDILTSVTDPVSGQSAIALTSSNMTARFALLNEIAGQLKTVAVGLQTIQTALAPVQALTPSATAPLGQTLSTLLSQALTGTYNASSGVSQTASAASGLGLGTLLTQTLLPFVQSGGPLDQLNSSMTALAATDAGATACP